MTKIIALVTCSILVLTSCDKFQYDIYETNRLQDDETVKTQYNIDRLLRLPWKNKLNLVFTGDTQRYYDDTEDLVEAVNALPEVDAVIITGDISEFGAAFEYVEINKELKKLKVPFISVIGNHDCLANGIELYEDIYGPINYSFTWNGIRFIMHNTNGREFNFNGNVPDINWMQTQLADTQNYSNCIFVSHVPPYSDDFDSSLEDSYTSLISNAKNTIFSANGHRHDFELSQPYGDNTWYLNTSSPFNRIFSLVSIDATDAKKFTCTNIAY